MTDEEIAHVRKIVITDAARNALCDQQGLEDRFYDLANGLCLDGPLWPCMRRLYMETARDVDLAWKHQEQAPVKPR